MQLPQRAWLVDLDGTLYSPTPVKLCMAVELLLFGRSALPAIRAFRHAHEELREDLCEAVASPWQLQVQMAAEQLGIDAEKLEPQIREWMVRRPGRWLRRFRRAALLREIAAFRAAGGRTALVSDYPARDKLAAMGASELFEVIVANGEEGQVGLLKPWPDGFLSAARQLGVDTADCLVIGDREDADGDAARAAGMAFRLVR